MGSYFFFFWHVEANEQDRKVTSVGSLPKYPKTRDWAGGPKPGLWAASRSPTCLLPSLLYPRTWVGRKLESSVGEDNLTQGPWLGMRTSLLGGFYNSVPGPGISEAELRQRFLLSPHLKWRPHLPQVLLFYLGTWEKAEGGRAFLSMMCGSITLQNRVTAVGNTQFKLLPSII